MMSMAPFAMPYFYPRSPRGERPKPSGASGGCRRISIHAPREGSDICSFQGKMQPLHISIHAPREGSDCCRSFQTGAPRYFYPRSPRGERPGPLTSSVLKCVFLSTLPARGATLPYPAAS